MSSSLVEEYRTSEDFRTSLGTFLRSDQSFNDQDTYSELVNATESFTEQDVEKLSEAQSDLQAKENAYSTAQSRASNIGEVRTIDQGRRWKTNDDMINKVERNTSHLEGGEKRKAMVQEAKDLGFDNKAANLFANTLMDETYTAFQPDNAGKFEKAAGIDALMRNHMDMSDYANVMIRNDDRINDQQVKKSADMEQPINTTDTSGAEMGAAKDAFEAKGKKPLIAPDGKLSAKDQKEAAILSNEVDSNTNFLQRQEDFQEAIALKANNISARGDSASNFVDRFVGGPGVLTTTPDHVELNGPNAPIEGPLSLKEDMKDQAASRALMLVQAAAIAADYAKENGQNEEDQQWQSDLTMSNLLREIDKESFDRLKGDGGDSEQRKDAQKFLESKLSAAGIQTDLSSIKEFATDIDSGKNFSGKGLQPASEVASVNNLDPMERLGNLLRGIDNKGEEERRKELSMQAEGISELGGYGSYAFADDKSNDLYTNVYKELSEKREDGEYAADVYGAELVAMAPFAAINNEGQNLENVLSTVRDDGSAFNGGGVMTMLSGGNGPAGFSITREQVQDIFDKEMGEGAYQKYRDELPNSVKEESQAKIDEIISQKVAEINKKMNPESPEALALDNALSLAISEMSKDKGEVEVLQNIAKENPTAVLSAASRSELYSNEDRDIIGASGLINKVSGEGSFEQAKNQVIGSELQGMFEANNLDEQAIIEMVNEKFGEDAYSEYEEWKTTQ